MFVLMFLISSSLMWSLMSVKCLWILFFVASSKYKEECWYSVNDCLGSAKDLLMDFIVFCLKSVKQDFFYQYYD